jgi:hemoglobin
MRVHVSLLAVVALAVATAPVAAQTPARPASRPAAATTPRPSLYERLGGAYPIAVVVDEFVERLLVNETLNANAAINEARARVPKAGLKFHVTSLVCQATGGPQKYTGRTMKEAHAHLRITEKEWDEMVRVFVGVLDKYKVPKAEQGELLQIVGSTKGDIVVAETQAGVN